ncbi:N,N'-diacetylbacillosaminyl-diphospho-undecaprenol alpha-1,3-N-acetylgalactosaminyltransferase [Muribaculaceae bacterium]|jgi:Glycosyltransferase|nr:N,N'-diacetylbacillosaminyl-diphospho-undecaprenol alpha-1,3-N-acetylgalactosaminyltransferase [Muribaculaceae bacterium]
MKIIRTSTIPTSLNVFCRGLFQELKEDGYDLVAVSSPGPALDELEKRENVRAYRVPMQRHISPLKDLKSLWQLIRVFHKEKPEMVHSITPKAGLLSMIAAWICRVPVRLHTFTGLIFPTSTGFKQKVLILTDRITCSCATHIVPEGEGVKDDLLKFNITKKTLKVLGHGNIRGIDLKHYSKTSQVIEKASELRRSDVCTYIFVGRVVRDKGINELIRSFELLNRKNPQTRLILVGSFEPNLDPLNPEILEEINTNPAIETVGKQNDVRPWLAASDIFVFPSYREGFPNVVIEAGAMDLPSIVTDINGSREIIEDGKNGIIIPPHDAEALYKAMLSLYHDQEYRNKLSANARNMIATRFEQSYVRNCLKEYYNSIINGFVSDNF